MRVSIYFKRGNELNERGTGMLDDLLTVSARQGDTTEQRNARIARTFGLNTTQFKAFAKRNALTLA